ncbi:hypothetical protein Afil01_66150 [Actinorhabdospora filicis]|uniref:Uncharacterized protein n=1 Tax=Actinorhabdospora filicis TaxID=1785913 RepID=A0A9W6STJ8_9ACTN|nr:hypothetical protein [Actinorhabdospora filicis]GLZ81808.1 hypothetical protein Afil01_66150 [Actinorhabdospora filicis]
MTAQWSPPSPGWEVSAHPASPYRFGADTAAAGEGILDLRLGGRRDTRSAGVEFAYRDRVRVPRPQAPVVLVDGRPALQGWGHARVSLPSGPRVVEVQAGVSRVCRVVEVPERGAVELDYAHLWPNRFDSGEDEAALGPRGRTAERPGLFARLLGRGAAPVPVDGVFLLDPGSRAVPELPGGHGGVLVRARFAIAPNSRDRLDALVAAGGDATALTSAWLTLGEPAPLAHRPWVAPFTLAVAGRTRTLPWGSWLVPVPEGVHEVVLDSTAPAASLVDGDTVVDLAMGLKTAEARVRAGKVTELRYHVSVTLRPRAAGPALDEYATTVFATAMRLW